MTDSKFYRGCALAAVMLLGAQTYYASQTAGAVAHTAHVTQTSFEHVLDVADAISPAMMMGHALVKSDGVSVAELEQGYRHQYGIPEGKEAMFKTAGGWLYNGLLLSGQDAMQLLNTRPGIQAVRIDNIETAAKAPIVRTFDKMLNKVQPVTAKVK